MMSEQSFYVACSRGELINVERFLFSNTNVTDYVVRGAFCDACATCQLEVARWIYSIFPNCQFEESRCIDLACYHSRDLPDSLLSLSQWMLTINSNISITPTKIMEHYGMSDKVKETSKKIELVLHEICQL